jgi:Flp pilus assembly pilin Flp
MWRRVRNRRGQQLVEYLIMVALIVAAIIAIAPTIRGHVDTLLGNAATQTETAATKLGGLATK